MPASAATISELRDKIQQIEQGSLRHANAANHESGAKIEHARSASSERCAVAQRKGSPASRSTHAKNAAKQQPFSFTEEQAFRKIERLVCLREHASKALQARLVKDGFSEDVARAAVERAQRCGLVSNERFADVLVRSRLSQGKGLQGIAAELTALDIDPLSVPEYLEAKNHEQGPDELARALALLDAKPPRSKHLRESAYRKLMQKGYGASVSASAARIWSEEHVAAMV